jgi:hypothetical protein
VPRLIHCAVDAPASFAPLARYALEEMLRGLGLVPRLVEPRDLDEGGLYYGLRPEAAPAGTVALGLSRETVDYFASERPYDPAAARRAPVDGLEMPILFTDGQCGPDLLASAFFWLSGWQETTCTARDAHGRFPFSASLQDALGCVDVPLVDHYRRHLGALLASRGLPVGATKWAGAPWALVCTHDVDHGRKRRLGTAARALSRRDGKTAAALRQAVGGPDPRLAAIDRFAAAERRLGAGATYFFKAARRTRFDAPYPLAQREVRRRLRDLAVAGFEIGLHPGYFAHDNPARLAAERDLLAAATGVPPSVVRQHFLRHEPALTPRIQHEAGLRIDSTLGFASREGFRRGTCHPFRLWDLRRRAALDLWEMPLSVMDTTLFQYRRLEPPDALEAAWRVARAASRVGGCGVILWHNTAFDEVDYPGQGAVYERLLERAAADGAALLSIGQAIGTAVADPERPCGSGEALGH